MFVPSKIHVTKLIIHCYRLIVFPKMHMLKPNLQCDDIGRWALWEVIRA